MKVYRILFAVVMVCIFLPGCFGTGGQQHDRLHSMASVTAYGTKTILKIAVADFESTLGEKYFDGVSTFVPYKFSGSRMADVFSTRILSLPSCKVIERSQLNRILEEQKLQMSDLVKSTNLKRVGSLLGVDALAFGRTEGWSWTNKFGWGNSLAAQIRLVAIESGELIWSVEGSIVRVNSLDDLYSILADDMFKKLNDKIEGRQ